MARETTIAGAQEMIRAGKPFVLGTVDRDGAPQMRWMGGLLLELPLTIYMAAGADSRKMRQIRANPRAQLMFQDEDFAHVATLSGTCEIVEDIATKRRVWDGIPGCAEHFGGPEDPNFGVIKFVCRRVELLATSESHEPAVAEM
jgi:general stress protein 26